MSTEITLMPTRVNFEKDGFVIYKCVKKGGQSVSAKGYVIGDSAELINQQVKFSISSVENNNYGETIAFSAYSIIESEGYFFSVYCKLGQSTCEQIKDLYGNENAWLDEEGAKQKLIAVKGIGEKKAQKILDRWTEYQGVKKLSEALAPYEISQRIISDIYLTFGDKSFEKLSENPYCITDIRGIGFKKADEIALKMGVDERSEFRFAAAISYAMEQFAKDGHTAVLKDNLLGYLNENLIMSDGDTAFRSIEVLMKTLNNPELKVSVKAVAEGSDFVALEKFIRMEGYIADCYQMQVKNHPVSTTLDQAYKFIEGFTELKLGEQQKSAILMSCTKGPIVINIGYAGTGKSTVSKALGKALMSILKLEKSDIVCCALSGVAANRIKTQSGFSGGTIHSVLGWNGKEFAYNQDNPLPYRLVMLDEASMVDTWLMYSLFKAIDFKNTKLIMLGDTEQLPPVGAGQPLSDAIELGLSDNSKLTQLFRTSEDKAIAVIAQQIRSGNVPKFEPHYTDAFFVPVNDHDRETVNKRIFDSMMKSCERNRWRGGAIPAGNDEIFDYLYQYQIITARKSGALSTEELNKVARDLLLPAKSEEVFSKTSAPMCAYEKVIHLKNENMTTTKGDEVRIFNGMIGMVVKVDAENEEVVVRYPIEQIDVTYTESDIRKGLLSYAWALTIHKTQGAEFQNVVIPLTYSHYNMLNTRLLYTAVTRAKGKVALVGESKALWRGSTNLESVKRDTVLNKLLGGQLAERKAA